MDFIPLMGYKVYFSALSQIENKQEIINTINPHSYCIAKKNNIFRQALQNSTVLLPDGIGIVWASFILKGIKIKKIAGADIHIHLLEKANKNNMSVFYLGANENTLQKIATKINVEFPNIMVSSYSPPFKAEFTAEDNHSMIAAINAFKPDILFVGMTAPKQEKWVYQNKEKINVAIIASIGAVFDFYAGTVKRASPFWINLGLEWLPRFIKQPRRLWRRLFISFPVFMWDVFKAKIGLLKF